MRLDEPTSFTSGNVKVCVLSVVVGAAATATDVGVTEVAAKANSAHSVRTTASIGFNFSLSVNFWKWFRLQTS